MEKPTIGNNTLSIRFSLAISLPLIIVESIPNKIHIIKITLHKNISVSVILLNSFLGFIFKFSIFNYIREKNLRINSKSIFIIFYQKFIIKLFFFLLR